MLDYNKVNFEFEQDPVWVPYQFTNLQFALIESFARIRAFPLYTRLVFAPLLKSWFRWEKVSEVVPRVLLLLVWYYIHWREMLDYNKESLNLSRTQCGPFINLQICSLLWLKFEFKWDPVWVLYQFTNLQFALIESFAGIRAFPLYTHLVFAPLLKSWFCWEKVSEVLPRVLVLLVLLEGGARQCSCCRDDPCLSSQHAIFQPFSFQVTDPLGPGSRGGRQS